VSHERHRAHPGNLRLSPTADAKALPLWRLHAMRVGYAVMGVGLAVVKWPLVINYDHLMPLYEGVVALLLTAMSLLAFLGLRYPVRMLPIPLTAHRWPRVPARGELTGTARSPLQRQRPPAFITDRTVSNP
jgi:hypothetical protein